MGATKQKIQEWILRAGNVMLMAKKRKRKGCKQVIRGGKSGECKDFQR